MGLLQIAPGSVVDQRFLITEAVASGGMGTVFRARDLQREDTVALKVLFGRSSLELARFDRERQLLQDLHHPGIVRYVAHGLLADGAPYLAMEWLSGEDLASRLKRQLLTVAETVALAVAAISALKAAHQSGIVHRDIKPANLFLPGGEIQKVKLLDFGIARHFAAAAATRTGTVVGTPDYMAPEQVRGEREIDARADLFSLGCVLYECLIGTPPFASAEIMGVFGKILFEPAPDLGSQRLDLPEALCRLVMAMLEKDRAQRPAQAADVLTALLSIPTAELVPPASRLPSPRSRPHGLTTHEQRLLSIVVVAAPPPVTPDAETVIAAPEQTWLELVEALGQPFGARTEQLPDGSVLALLTGQPTATDQARQAARLALRLRARFWQKEQSPGRPALALPRIAVCTGRGDIERAVFDTGCIDRAVSLLCRVEKQQPHALSLDRLAEDGDPEQKLLIVVDDMTRGLLGTQFVTHKDKDKKGEELTLLVREQATDEPVRLVLGRSTPFFGRERELGSLLAILGDCIDEPRARVVLITADAGMGKSRLCQEFMQRATAEHNELAVFIGRSDPITAGSPFALLAQSLRHALSLKSCGDSEGDGETLMRQRQRVRDHVSRRLPVPPHEQLRIYEFLCELLALHPTGPTTGSATLDLPSEALKAARLDPMLMGDQVRRAVLEFLSAECDTRPLLWVLEDLHWGDFSTVKLVDIALRELSERPFFVLALGRPTIHQSFPRLFADRGIQEIHLSGLSRKAAEKLARSVLGSTQQVHSILGLLERAGGNAFFLEEMLRAAADGQLTEAPATVLAMVQSRIERLEPQARRVLRAACVFGSTFWRDGVEYLLGDSSRASDVDPWLEVLDERELISRRSESRFSGDAEYTFVHALARDAAYAMLTDADRLLGHRLAAQFLEKKGERDAVALAEHWERSSEPQRAISWYMRATWQALEGSDLDTVLRHAERAIACGAQGPDLGEMRAAQADAQQWRGMYQETIRHGRAAMELLPARSPRWFLVAGAMAIAGGRTTDGKLLQVLCNKLLEVAAQGESSDEYLTAAVRTALQLYIAGDYFHAKALLDTFSPILKDGRARPPGVEAMVCLVRANRAVYEWKLDVAIGYYLQSAELFETIGDLRNAASQRLDAALFYLDVGNYTRSEQLAKEIIEVAGRLGAARLSSVAYAALGSALFWMQRYDELAALWPQISRQALLAGDRRITGASLVLSARRYLAQGHLQEAEKEIEQAVTILSEMPRFRARALAVRARVFLSEGRAAEGLHSASQSYAILQTLGRLGTDEALVRLVYAAALHLQGDSATANEVLRVGRQRLLAQAACISDPQAHTGFLALPEHAELLLLTEDPASPPAALAPAASS